MPYREGIAQKLGQGEDEADEPGVLVQSPELEGDAAGSNALFCWPRASRVSGAAGRRSRQLSVVCLHTRGIPFLLQQALLMPVFYHLLVRDGSSSETDPPLHCSPALMRRDRKSTRLNSSHQIISYPVFCLKKKQYN